LLFDSFTSARIFRVPPFGNFLWTCAYYSSAMFQWDEKQRRLTYTPPVNAAAASTVENYGENDRIIPRYGTMGEKLPDR
jgi:hypothetical protein